MAEEPSGHDRDRNVDPNDWRPQRHKIRRIVFTKKDEAILSEALRDSFPTVKFVQRLEAFAPPRSQDAFSSLPDVPDNHVYIVVPSSAEWRPVCRLDPQDGRWSFENIPRHGHLTYYGSYWDWAFFGSPIVSYDPPTLSEGQIFNSYEPWNPDHLNFLALVRKTWRIISRIATNRYKRGHPLGNQLMGCEHQLMKDAKGGDLWLGHQALEWSRQNPRRMLCGSLRTCDDWDVPKNEWYQSLLRRVDERYGPKFGEPPSEPPGRGGG